MRTENLYWVENNIASRLSKAKSSSILGNVEGHSSIYRGVPTYSGVNNDINSRSNLTFAYDVGLDQVTETITYYPVPDIQIQQRIKSYINSTRDFKRSGGFETTLSTSKVIRIDTDERAEQNINGQVTNIALGSVAEDITWTDYDNADIVLTVAEFTEMYDLATLFLKNLHKNGKIRKNHVDTLTYDALVAFDIFSDIIVDSVTYSWPTSIQETEDGSI